MPITESPDHYNFTGASPSREYERLNRNKQFDPMNEPKSETPRTDANTIWGHACFSGNIYTTQDFARTLERELNEAKRNFSIIENANIHNASQCDQLREQLDTCQRNSIGSCSVCGGKSWSAPDKNKVEHCLVCQLRTELNEAKAVINQLPDGAIETLQKWFTAKTERDAWRACAEKLAESCEMVRHGTPGMGEALAEFNKLKASQ